VSRVIKIIQELVEDKPGELEKRFLYVILDIVKEQVEEVKKFGVCASRMRSRQPFDRAQGKLAAGSRQQAAGSRQNDIGESSDGH
jgi:hypothetical protein